MTSGTIDKLSISRPKVAFQELRRTATEMDRLKVWSERWSAEGLFWTYENIIRLLNRPGSRVWYLKLSSSKYDDWAGVIFVDLLVDHADLVFIYIEPQYRSNGFGLLLLQKTLIELQTQRRLGALLLEVRVSNFTAISLYKTCGFEPVSIRRSYYSDGEDAVVYRYGFS